MIVFQKSLNTPDQHDHAHVGKMGQVIRKSLSILNLDAVIEVGVDGKHLAEELHKHSVRCVPLDTYADKEAGTYAFDLTKVASHSEIDQLKKQMPNPTASYLTSCLGKLPQLEREQISTAIWNLREICDEYLLVSIDTAPSSDFNRLHQTVAPRHAWLRLFEEAGFELTTHSELNDSPAVYAGRDAWSLQHWQKLDPFRDQSDGAALCCLLRKRESVDICFEQFDESARSILGIPVASQIEWPANTHVTFLLGHYQEFLQFQAFFDEIPNHQFRVLIRSGAYRTLEERRLLSIVAYLEKKGISYEYLHAIDQVRWKISDTVNEVLITAVDSTATKNHLINSSIVERARAEGIPTFQLQHGIWPHAEFPEEHTVLCDHLLNWSDDYQKPFLLNSDVRSKNLPARHSTHNVGCPRFDVYADPRRLEIANLLGEWTTRFDHSVVVATNLHWPLHSQGSDVLPQLFQTAREMPRTLFLCKMHPVHDFDESAFAGMPSNVVVIDEFASIYADLSTPRLISACDAVVCTLSTVALEAALAGRPFAILETGNPNRYEGTQTVPISKMTEEVNSLLQQGNNESSYHNFVQQYYSVPNNGSALTSIAKIIASVVERPAYDADGVDLAVRTLSLELLHALEENYQLKSTSHSPSSLPGQDMSVANHPKERWRHLRKYARSIQKRLPWFHEGK